MIDGEPFTPSEAKSRIRVIIVSGTVTFHPHARREMTKDGLMIVDILNVLRAGVVEPAEWENGEWRYRVHSQRIWAVVAFVAETEILVITAWRTK